MSSRATIISTNSSHIYEETNNRQFSDGGLFLGFDIALFIDLPSIKRLRLSESRISIRIKDNSELKVFIKEPLFINLSDTDIVEIDETDLFISVKGGTETAKEILKLK